MKIANKDKIKPIIFFYILITIIELLTIIIISNVQYNKIQGTVNSKISEIIGQVEYQYPNVSEKEIISILNSKIKADDTLLKYGIDVQDGLIIKQAEDLKNNFIINNIIILTISKILIFSLFIIYIKYRDKKVDKITEYLKEINNKKYALNLDNMTEGELSKLENELYKITVMLKEDAENSKNEKVRLAESIADISHQLKTPLTSISIMLDNLNDKEDINPEIQKKFILEITKQVEWMKWLVISLLKFSKLDANAIQFKQNKIKVKNLIDQIIQNMSIPLEIKNIDIIVTGESETTFIGDLNWENEAITNILKNCIEHTHENKKIYISYEENNLYTKITIQDEGKGITSKDLPHIFERFYKGQNSSNDSYGIGLALSKSIIEKDNGIISCTSELDKGTKFEIKYAKI